MVNIRKHQVTDGTKRGDDILSGGSEWITPRLGLNREPIVVAAPALKENVKLYDEADSECRTAAPDITLKEDKDVPCLVAPEMNRSRL